MKTYREFSPTSFDTRGLGLPENQDWLVGPCGTNRDADVLTQANWKALNNELDKIDPDLLDHEVHRFGHWANGWFEIVIIRPNSKCVEFALECESGLANYPVLCENTLADLELESALDWWVIMSLKERVELCSKLDVNIFLARRKEPPTRCLEWLIDNI